MRGAFWALALSALLTCGAAADPYDVSNGVVIAHAPPGLVYTVDPPLPCDAYAAAPITGCDQQVNRIDIADEPMLWYVLLAWLEPKYWRAFEFGLGEYVAGAAGYLITDYGLCDPPGGSLTIQTEGWPGPNEGIAIAATDPGEETSWSGNFEPMYWFAGYAYSAQAIPLGPDPASASPEWPDGMVAILPLQGHGQPIRVNFDYEAPGVMGSMGMLTDGVAACPPADIIGACCFFGNECQVATLSECEARGGSYQGVGTDCDPNPCPTVWACCLWEGTPSAECFMFTEEDCAAYDGIWHEGEICANEGGTLFCDLPPQACCFGSECILMQPADCESQGGIVYPETSCESNPCPHAMACCIGADCIDVFSEEECADLGGVLYPTVQCATPGFACPEPQPVWACCFPSDEQCYMLSAEDCQAGGGTSFEGISCETENPCEHPVPTGPASWGAIKAIYR